MSVVCFTEISSGFLMQCMETVMCSTLTGIITTSPRYRREMWAVVMVTTLIIIIIIETFVQQKKLMEILYCAEIQKRPVQKPSKSHNPLSTDQRKVTLLVCILV